MRFNSSLCNVAFFCTQLSFHRVKAGNEEQNIALHEPEHQTPEEIRKRWFRSKHKKSQNFDQHSPLSETVDTPRDRQEQIAFQSQNNFPVDIQDLSQNTFAKQINIPSPNQSSFHRQRFENPNKDPNMSRDVPALPSPYFSPRAPTVSERSSRFPIKINHPFPNKISDTDQQTKRTEQDFRPPFRDNRNIRESTFTNPHNVIHNIPSVSNNWRKRENYYEWKYTELLIDNLWNHLLLREQKENLRSLLIQQKQQLLQLVGLRNPQ